MKRTFANDAGRLNAVELSGQEIEGLVWIDLYNPTSDEEIELERALALDIPTREEVQEIEISSRLYTTDGAAYMTAILPANVDEDAVEMLPLTFVLKDQRLITVRYHEPRAFETFLARAQKVSMGCETGEGVMIALLEALVDRLADILERADHDISAISQDIFARKGGKTAKSASLNDVINSIGRKGDLTSNIKHSLVTFDRLVGFLAHVSLQNKSGKEVRERVKTLSRDIRSLAEHAVFLSQKITFLLDATLGMISIEQSSIIKIFSVAAVVFLPPTLIASIYGMNFTYMPELEWLFGYPFAIVLMIISAILPYVFFRNRGWL